MKIDITLDKSVKFLDKRRGIENNDGFKRTVDAFRVVEMSGKSVTIMFIQLVDGNKHFRVMNKLKRVKYIDGQMIINICGKDYCIGKYTEVV